MLPFKKLNLILRSFSEELLNYRLLNNASFEEHLKKLPDSQTTENMALVDQMFNKVVRENSNNNLKRYWIYTLFFMFKLYDLIIVKKIW